MKFIRIMEVILVLLNICTGTGCFIPPADTLVNSQYQIHFLNSQNDGWVAGANQRFDGMTYNQTRYLLGTFLYPEVPSHNTETSNSTPVDIPVNFSVIEKWKGRITEIRDQKHCGSCWAFSAAEVLSDRISIVTKDQDVTVLSPEDLVSCDKKDDGCNGGQLPSAWNFLTKTGVVTDKCFPYTAGNGTPPACPVLCVDGTTWTPHKASSSYALYNVQAMQKDLMTNGPIQVAFEVYKSFFSYKSGVYKKKWYEIIPEGGHAVKLVGWGTEKGRDFWLVANSWGKSWGLSGYFKILRGVDECGIETAGPPYTGHPMLLH